MPADFKVGMVFRVQDLASSAIRSITQSFQALRTAGRGASSGFAAAPAVAGMKLAASELETSAKETAPAAAAAAEGVGRASSALGISAEDSSRTLNASIGTMVPAARGVASGVAAAGRELAAAAKTAAAEFDQAIATMPVAASEAAEEIASTGGGLGVAGSEQFAGLPTTEGIGGEPVRPRPAASPGSGGLKGILAGMEEATSRGLGANMLSMNLQMASGEVAGFAERGKGFLERAVETGNEFDFAMSKVRAKTDGTEKSFRALRGLALDLGSTTLFSSTQAAEGMEILAQQGWHTNWILKGTKPIIDLATAANISFGDATKVVTSALEGFQMPATQVAKMADLIAYAANASAADVGELGEAFSYTSSTAHSLGISANETAAMLASLHNAGIKGSRAGTAMQEFFVGLTGARRMGATGHGRDMLGRLLGIRSEDVTKNLRDPIKLIHELDAATRKMGTGERYQKITAIFGQSAAQAVIALMAQSRANENGKLDLFNKEFNDKTIQGKAAAVAGTVSSNQWSALKELGNLFQNLSIIINDSLKPVLGPVIEAIKSGVSWVGRFLERHRVLAFVVGIAAAAFVLLFTAVATGLGLLASLAGLVGLVQIAIGALPIVTNLAQLGMYLLSASVGTAATSFWALAVAMLANPITWIVVGIGLLITGAVLLVKHWTAVKKFFIGVWEWLKAHEWLVIFMPLLLIPIAIVNHWAEVKGFFVGLWGWVWAHTGWVAVFLPFVGIPLLIVKHWSAVKTFFSGLWAWIESHAGWVAVFNPLVGIPALIVKHWTPVKKFFVDLWHDIGKILHALGAGFVRAGGKLLETSHADVAGGQRMERLADSMTRPKARELGKRVETIGPRKAASGLPPRVGTRVGGELRITIDHDGVPAVASLSREGPMDISVDTGLSMRSAY